MGRGKIPVDMEAALDLVMRGESVPTVARELGISPPTLRGRIAELSKKQGLLLQYRSLQSLQLTELQARVLEAITPEKIESASLKDLVGSYKILKDKEQVIEGKPTEIKGLVAHLIALEKRDITPDGRLIENTDDLVDATFEEVGAEDPDDGIDLVFDKVDLPYEERFPPAPEPEVIPESKVEPEAELEVVLEIPTPEEFVTDLAELDTDDF